jgi:UDP-GlcNAc:undecaprenyl-phosphate GlcNAc-1-phosphate transferase
LRDLLVALIACAVTVLVTPLMILVARRGGIVDRPGALKPQSRSVAYLGGVAVLAGVCAGATGRPWVLVPMGAATVLGVTDDRFDLSPLVRLVGQGAVGAAVVVTCPVHLPGPLAAIGIVATTVVLVNGVNLMDGLDMLASGVVGVGSLAFAVLLAGDGRQLAIGLAAALLGFLVYNRPPARIYLGDGGSYLLGTALVVLLADTWSPGSPTPRAAAALSLVALPAAEVGFAMVRRLRGHRSVFAGDRGHPYDRLVARGWSRPVASLAYIGTQTLLAAMAVWAGLRASVGVALALDAVAAGALIAGAAAIGGLTPDRDVLA